MTSDGSDCWLSRVKKIQDMLNLPDTPRFKRLQGKKCAGHIRSKFDRFWLDSLNSMGTKSKNLSDNIDHNKLRTYRLFKSSFTREPYVDLVRNRNQRSFLSRLRTGSHHLNIEKGRWTRPVTPVDQRTCQYCTPPSSARSSPCSGQSPSTSALIDNEEHFLMSCSRFSSVRRSAFEEISFIFPHFLNLSVNRQFCTLLCPTDPKIAKITNRLIKQMFNDRERMDKSNGNDENAKP